MVSGGLAVGIPTVRIHLCPLSLTCTVINAAFKGHNQGKKTKSPSGPGPRKPKRKKKKGKEKEKERKRKKKKKTKYKTAK